MVIFILLNISFMNLNENVVLLSICNWIRRFIDKFGICYECKMFINIVIEYMFVVFYNFFFEEVNNFEKLLDILGCLYNFNYGSLFDINY